jgi:hypothetical protein
VIDPSNFHLFYQYEKGVLQADDISGLLKDGCLLVTGKHRSELASIL